MFTAALNESLSLVQVERVFTAALIQTYLSLSALGTTGLSGTDSTLGTWRE